MRFLSLQSGSNGNALYVEAGGVRLVFDAGISGAQLSERLAARGAEAKAIDALFISHDHSDHIRGAGVFARKFEMPVYVTERTFAVSKRRAQLGDIAHVCHFRAGSSVKIGGVTIHTIGTPHDAVDGSIFVVDDGVRRIGICTDVGHVYDGLRDVVANVDALFVESNYDERMLATGKYHPALKRRIRGPGGHISNIEAAELVAESASSRLQWLSIGHLSEENNTPELAMKAHREALGNVLPIHLASRYGVGEWCEVAGARPAVPVLPPRSVQLELRF